MSLLHEQDFHGGLRGLPEHKELSTGQPIGELFMPSRLVLPLCQGVGAEAEPVVTVGERVLKGQLLAQAKGSLSTALHAPTSGQVSAIEPRLVPHPSGLPARCIELVPDGEDRWGELPRLADPLSSPPEVIQAVIVAAGLAGLGGAGFPTAVKLGVQGRPVKTLLINAAECEPYITCDDMLMRERAAAIAEGIQILRHLLAAGQVVVATEDNKPEAAAAMSRALAGLPECEILSFPTAYPSGGEKQLIELALGKQVPYGGLPLDIGVVCLNVGTVYAVRQAVMAGEPLISRIVTVTGDGANSPGNYEVLIGTPVNELVAHAGGATDGVERCIMGGPMMGFMLPNDRVPVIKTTNCVLLMQTEVPAVQQPTMPCIRCGACADVCPASLLPQQLYWYARAENSEKLEHYQLFDCIECGCCSYVCPSRIPLVQYYRAAKGEIVEQQAARAAADIARQRTEFRAARLAAEKQQRAERVAKKKAALKEQGSNPEADAKKAKIAEAMKRVGKLEAPSAESADEQP
ncbi:MAG: electron transport complex subunit RsxC [Gammaproteobacteria bacterium]|nr:electron transport complex subunit RsxC [Gammaproteobacteria bacterium]